MPLDGFWLISSLIVDTNAQETLVAWKEKYSHIRKNVKTVGSGYWQGFMQRNKHLIVSRKGQKYELNRSNWTTHQNLPQIYESIEEEFIVAGAAVKLDNPVWMNGDGDVVDEQDTFGCKVTI